MTAPDHRHRHPAAGHPSARGQPWALDGDANARTDYCAGRALDGRPRHHRGYQQRHGADPVAQGGLPPQCRRAPAGRRQAHPDEPATGPLRSRSYPAADRSPLARRFRERAARFSERYDDQVDALLLAVEWYAQNEQYLRAPIYCQPILFRLANPFPWDTDPWPFE